MLELSGLAWAPTLERYLGVVDDSIDLDDGQRHGPFVLALDRTGHLDADPVPIDGVDAIDDAEALAAGPDNLFFLLTSHSPNRRGKLKEGTPPAPSPQDRGPRLRVTGSLDLTRGQDGVARSIESSAYPKRRRSTWKALAFHDGALYVGLKAPLLADEWAIILRFDRPSEAFADGRLSPTVCHPGPS